MHLNLFWRPFQGIGLPRNKLFYPVLKEYKFAFIYLFPVAMFTRAFISPPGSPQHLAYFLSKKKSFTLVPKNHREGLILQDG